MTNGVDTRGHGWPRATQPRGHGGSSDLQRFENFVDGVGMGVHLTDSAKNVRSSVLFSQCSNLYCFENAFVSCRLCMWLYLASGSAAPQTFSGALSPNPDSLCLPHLQTLATSVPMTVNCPSQWTLQTLHHAPLIRSRHVAL